MKPGILYKPAPLVEFVDLLIITLYACTQHWERPANWSDLKLMHVRYPYISLMGRVITPHRLCDWRMERAAVGRTGTHLPGPSRHLERQFCLSHLWQTRI